MPRNFLATPIGRKAILHRPASAMQHADIYIIGGTSRVHLIDGVCLADR